MNIKKVTETNRNAFKRFGCVTGEIIHTVLNNSNTCRRNTAHQSVVNFPFNSESDLENLNNDS